MRNKILSLFIFVMGLFAALTTPLLTARADDTSEKQRQTNIPSHKTPKRELKITKGAEPPIIWHKRYRHIDKVTGLRTAYYRAALPPKVPGGTRIDVKQAYDHFKNKDALFIDVMAHTGTGPDPIDGFWRLSEPRSNIPGSYWLADVGTGTLTPEMQHYYKENLKKITGSDKTKALILYCTADCWMAWNAVRRASRLGYTNLLWFPEGSDEWSAAGYPLKNSVPIPLDLDENIEEE